MTTAPSLIAESVGGHRCSGNSLGSWGGDDLLVDPEGLYRYSARRMVDGRVEGHICSTAVLMCGPESGCPAAGSSRADGCPLTDPNHQRRSRPFAGRPIRAARPHLTTEMTPRFAGTSGGGGLRLGSATAHQRWAGHQEAPMFTHLRSASTLTTPRRRRTAATAGFSGDGGPAVLATMDNPVYPTVYPLGKLVFSDTDNNVVRRLQLPATRVPTATATPAPARPAPAPRAPSRSAPSPISSSNRGSLPTSSPPPRPGRSWAPCSPRPAPPPSSRPGSTICGPTCWP